MKQTTITLAADPGVTVTTAQIPSRFESTPETITGIVRSDTEIITSSADITDTASTSCTGSFSWYSSSVCSELFDDAYSATAENVFYYPTTGSRIIFDLGSEKIVQSIDFWSLAYATYSTWQVKYSDDGSTWVAVSGATWDQNGGSDGWFASPDVSSAGAHRYWAAESIDGKNDNYYREFRIMGASTSTVDQLEITTAERTPTSAFRSFSVDIPAALESSFSAVVDLWKSGS